MITFVTISFTLGIKNVSLDLSRDKLSCPHCAVNFHLQALDAKSNASVTCIIATYLDEKSPYVY